MGKRGPAPRGEYTDKSAVLSTRIRADTRAALERAAKKNRRSLSQEIERRLRRSFEDEESIAERFGSPQVYALMRTIGAAMAMAASNASTLKKLNGPLDWLSDPWAYDQACQAVGRVLGALAPEGEPTPPLRTNSPSSQSIEAKILNLVGAGNANGMLEAIRTADANGTPLQRLAARIRDDLGSLAQRIDSDFERKFTNPPSSSDKGDAP